MTLIPLQQPSGPHASDPEMSGQSLSTVLARLATQQVLRPHQVDEIVARRHESCDDRWAIPTLRDVREHTRAQVDSLLAP